MITLNHASRRLLALSAIAGLITFSACSKDDDDTAIEPDASVKIVNVLPESGSVNVFNGESKLNSSAIEYNTATGYMSIAKGKKTLDFKTAVTGNTVLSYPAEFKGGNYSLFATGTTSDNKTEGILTEDKLDAPASGKAKVRFVHASVNAPTVNFLLNDSLLATNSAYKSVSEFKEMAAGTYTVKLNNANSGETAIQRADVVLAAGKIYTIAAVGVVNNNVLTQQGFAISLISNN